MSPPHPTGDGRCGPPDSGAVATKEATGFDMFHLCMAIPCDMIR